MQVFYLLISFIFNKLHVLFYFINRIINLFNKYNEVVKSQKSVIPVNTGI
jgi:hypothetical protein